MAGQPSLSGAVKLAMNPSSPPTWLTFTDFLFDYIKAVLIAWGLSEQAKPESKQHPLMGWLRCIAAFQAAHAQSKRGNIYTAPITGVVRADLGAAERRAAHGLPAQFLQKRLRPILQKPLDPLLPSLFHPEDRDTKMIDIRALGCAGDSLI